MAKPPTDSDRYNESEAAQRMNDALRRALTTPHKPHADLKGKKGDGSKRRGQAKTK